jgi:flagellar biosynthesis/type III secretory pathway protein FliH
MLTQDELERERYLSRLKKQRDDAFFPKAMREEGLAEGRAAGLAEGRAAGLAEGQAEGLAKGAFIGRIQLAQRLLKRPTTSKDELASRSLAELEALANELENEALSAQ